ncbi:MAG TPA: lipid-A-disaccharide synthase [Bryobacteraceae bacterium]
MAAKILISAGEASGDLYAASLAVALRARIPEAEFFGCAGPRMQAAGVRPVVDASSLAVVGLVEVVSHIPRIYGEYRKLARAARDERPDVAILTDSPDFHLRLARRLKRLGVPVVYLVAPQAWAWRKGRLPAMRRAVDRLLCIFPFEEEFFRKHGIETTYIGHPLSTLVRPSFSKKEFFARHGLAEGRPLIAVLPGSRRGEAARHLPDLAEAIRLIAREKPVSVVVGLPAGKFIRAAQAEYEQFRQRISGASIQVVEGETWDVLAHADLALAASGTVATEAAVLGTPMVTFYKVTALSWLIGKLLVDVPFYSMVNLVAGRAIVPELIQNDMSGERLAAEALRLLNDPTARGEMRRNLGDVARKLAGVGDPIGRAAEVVETILATRR